MNHQAGKCRSCLDDELPCGPYETAEETREFLKKAVAHLHTINGPISQRTATGFSFDDTQPTVAEPQSQNVSSVNTSFMPQNQAPNVGFEDSQPPTTLLLSQETVNRPVSGIEPTSAAFTGSSAFEKETLDALYEPFANPFSDLGSVEPLSSKPQSSHVEDDDSSILSM